MVLRWAGEEGGRDLANEELSDRLPVAGLHFDHPEPTRRACQGLEKRQLRVTRLLEPILNIHTRHEGGSAERSQKDRTRGGGRYRQAVQCMTETMVKKTRRRRAKIGEM
eukprot:2748174-Rhodomonas_salina.1